jgi:hypothetical protein
MNIHDHDWEEDSDIMNFCAKAKEWLNNLNNQEKLKMIIWDSPAGLGTTCIEDSLAS